MKDVWTRDIFKSVFATHQNELNRPEDYINHSYISKVKHFFMDYLWLKIISMAHSLENRVPFLDNELVDFAMKCPVVKIK